MSTQSKPAVLKVSAEAIDAARAEVEAFNIAGLNYVLDPMVVLIALTPMPHDRELWVGPEPINGRVVGTARRGT